LLELNHTWPGRIARGTRAEIAHSLFYALSSAAKDGGHRLSHAVLSRELAQIF
jgi:hypothetical protein